MNKILLAVAVLSLGACANIPGYPPAQAQDDACFLATSKQALAGDFHDIVLPSWVPGVHLAAGQVSSCMAPRP